MKFKIERESALGGVVLNWWKSLEDSGSGRADRAGLRRSASIAAIEYSGAYQRIYQRLMSQLKSGESKFEFSDAHKQHLAAGIALLAHVKEDLVGQSLPKRFSKDKPDGKAEKSENERAPVSELRFLRLLDSPDAESLFVGLRRTLPLIDKKVDIFSLLNDVLNWDDEVKKRWAYDYEWPQKSAS